MIELTSDESRLRPAPDIAVELLTTVAVALDKKQMNPRKIDRKTPFGQALDKVVLCRGDVSMRDLAVIQAELGIGVSFAIETNR